MIARHIHLILLALVAQVAAAVTVHAITGTVEHLTVPEITDYELDQTVIPRGDIVFRGADFKDLRIGDGITPGGISTWNYSALTNPPGDYDRPLNMHGHQIELNSKYDIVATDNRLFVFHGTNSVFEIVGEAPGGFASILDYGPSESNVFLVAANTDGEEPPIIEYCDDLAAGDWGTTEYFVTRLTPTTLRMDVTNPPLNTLRSYRIVTDYIAPMAKFTYGLIAPSFSTTAGHALLTNEPLWEAAAGSVVRATNDTYTTTVAKAATAYGWGDHSAAGYAAPSTNFLYDSGTATVAAATMVLPNRVKSDSATSVGNYSFAAGYDTQAGNYSFAAGQYSTADNYSFAAGYNTQADECGFAAGTGTRAGSYGFAVGNGTIAGTHGFTAGKLARCTNDGSFVFSDSTAVSAYYDHGPNTFNVRVTGGAWIETGTNALHLTALELGGETRTNWPMPPPAETNLLWEPTACVTNAIPTNWVSEYQTLRIFHADWDDTSPSISLSDTWIPNRQVKINIHLKAQVGGDFIYGTNVVGSIMAGNAGLISLDYIPAWSRWIVTVVNNNSASMPSELIPVTP